MRNVIIKNNKKISKILLKPMKLLGLLIIPKTPSTPSTHISLYLPYSSVEQPIGIANEWYFFLAKGEKLR